jgi:hypothetical protein
MVWFVCREQLDGCRIMHVRNGREYRLSALPRWSVDGVCKKTNTVYEFCGSYWHRHTYLPSREVMTVLVTPSPSGVKGPWPD